jgi:aldose 1-epimerase
MGAIAGRFANRIRNGQFTLDGVSHQLARNENGRTALHGGGRGGFGKRPWTRVHADTTSVTLQFHSPDGDQGYPGAVVATCRYLLLPPATLRIELTATSDAPTIINLAHHSYFALDNSDDILDHHLTIHADQMAMVDEDAIPTGEYRTVAGTPFDFRTARPVRWTHQDGTRQPYDHSWILRGDPGTPSGISGMPLLHAATLASMRSGIRMETWTTEPVLQCYDGSKLTVRVPGLHGKNYGPCAGICLEPQHLPDSPNLPGTPSTVLRPDRPYQQVTEYRFFA